MTLSRFNAGTRAHKLSGWHPQHEKKKKKKKKEGGRGKEEGGGLNFSVVYVEFSLRFWGFTCIKYSATDQVIIQNNFSYIHFFLIYFWGVTGRLQYYLLSFVARFLVTESISVYYQLPWFETKKRYYIFVKFTVISFTTVNTQSIVSPSDFICFKEKIITQENLDIKNTMAVAQYAKAQPVCWIKTVRQIKELCKWDFFLLKLFHVPKRKWP